jgi:hypothetical protein
MGKIRKCSDGGLDSLLGHRLLIERSWGNGKTRRWHLEEVVLSAVTGDRKFFRITLDVDQESWYSAADIGELIRIVADLTAEPPLEVSLGKMTMTYQGLVGKGEGR